MSADLCHLLTPLVAKRPGAEDLWILPGGGVLKFPVLGVCSGEGDM